MVLAPILRECNHTNGILDTAFVFTNAKFSTLAVMLRLIAVFLDQLRALYGRDLGVSLALLGLPRNVLS